jgi:uncharacterized membrane protein YhaH (DUF805 family)
MNDSDLLKKKHNKRSAYWFWILFIIAIGTMMDLYAANKFNPVLLLPCFESL